MSATLLAHLFNGLLVIAMPVGLAIFFRRKFHLTWHLWWIGAGTFILSQVAHIPFNWVIGLILNRTAMVFWPKSGQLIFNAAFLGLSAGLFEELFRYGMFRWWAKDARSWSRGMMTGVGHGGAEAILFVGVPVLLAFVNMSVARLPAIQTALTPVQVELVNAYWSIPWYAALLGALERFFTIPVQIALAVIVLQAFLRGQGIWVWLAVLYHAFIDAIAVFAARNNGVYWTEAVIGFFALLSVIIIFALRQPEPVQQIRPSTPQLVSTFTPAPPEETSHNLDETRYQ
jgi:uncharacterized membrane protein YhfC